MENDQAMKQLKADLKNKKPGNFYVFHGTETYLRDYYLSSLHKLLVEDFAEAFNYHRFHAGNITLQAVLDSMEAIPMMSPTSMVQIDDVDFFSIGEDASDYAKFFSNIPDYCTVVMVYDTVPFKMDQRKKALAEAFSHALIVDFEQPSERELVTWIGRHFKKHGLQITVDDAQFLIHRTGGDMTTLLGEIEKLSAYEKEPVVQRQSIVRLIEPVLEAAAYDLSDAMIAGKYETALQCLRVLLQRQEEPVMILGAISSQMRRIVTARQVIEAGKGKQELMKLCGTSSYPAQKALEAARRLKPAFCEKAVELCLEADRQMKTSFDSPDRILELLVLELAGEAAHA